MITLRWPAYGGVLFALLALSVTAASASLFTKDVPPGFLWSKAHDGWSIGVLAQDVYTLRQPMPIQLAIRNVSRYTMDGNMMECLRLDAFNEDNEPVSMAPPGVWGCDQSVPMGDAMSGAVYTQQLDIENVFVWRKPGRYCVSVLQFGARKGSAGLTKFCFRLVANAAGSASLSS